MDPLPIVEYHDIFKHLSPVGFGLIYHVDNVAGVNPNSSSILAWLFLPTKTILMASVLNSFEYYFAVISGSLVYN